MPSTGRDRSRKRDKLVKVGGGVLAFAGAVAAVAYAVSRGEKGDERANPLASTANASYTNPTEPEPKSTRPESKPAQNTGNASYTSQNYHSRYPTSAAYGTNQDMSSTSDGDGGGDGGGGGGGGEGGGGGG